MAKHLSEKASSPEIVKGNIGNIPKSHTKSLASKYPGMAAECLLMIEKHCGKAFAQFVKQSSKP